MSHNYVVTAQPPTSVTLSLSANFTGPNDMNLIAAKGNHLDISLATSDGLKQVLNIGINGHVDAVLPFRPKSAKKDSLFVLTERLRCMIFCFNSETREVDDQFVGNLFQHTGRPCESGYLTIIDPKQRAIAMYLYCGMIKIIPLNQSSKHLSTFDVRVDQFDIIDMTFMDGYDHPTLAYIYQDDYGNRHLEIASIDLDDPGTKQTVFAKSSLEVESQMLIAVPAPVHGLLVIGQQTVLYLPKTYETGSVSVAPPELLKSVAQCYCCLDSKRILLGDVAGNLMMLLLLTGDDDMVVKELVLVTLGQVTSPRSISYLDNGVVYIGSCLGDSQLIRLLPETVNTEGNFSQIEIMDTFTGIGPIVDMVVVDQDRLGQGSVVTCSGYGHTGSLRVVRSGIGIHELATADFGAIIEGVWAVRMGVDTDMDSAIIMAFIEQSRVIVFDDDSLEELQPDHHDFEQNEQTLLAANLSFGFVVQVVPSKILLIETETRRFKQSWCPPDGQLISVAACNSEQIVVACRDRLFYLTVSENGVTLETEVTLDNEVSCLDVSVTTAGNRTDLCAVGLWKDISVLLVSLPSLKTVLSSKLGGDLVSRSVVKCVFEGQDYLFVTMGDGTVVYFSAEFHTAQLGLRKNVALGAVPSTMRTFHTLSSFNIFVCSDRPSVIYSSNQKLLFANVNVKAVDYVCPINCKPYPDSLVVVSKSVVTFGKVDNIQKLHIRTITLGECPRRVAFDETGNTFGVCVDTEVLSPLPEDHKTALQAQAKTWSKADASDVPSCPASVEVITQNSGMRTAINAKMQATFAVLDAHTFEVLHAHSLVQGETVCSLCVLTLSNEPLPFYCVGTALPLDEDEQEDRLGYIHMFQWKDEKFTCVHRKEVHGAVLNLISFNGKLLVAINNNVAVYEWTESKELRCDCQHSELVSVLYLKAKGDFILCGDLMRSLTLLQHKPTEGNLSLVASDFKTNWMYAIEILDDNSFIGAEEHGNLFAAIRDSTAANDDELRQLNIAGRFHLGDHINVFRQGSLTMKDTDDKVRQPSTLFGTVAGAVGMIITLDKPTYTLLEQVQAKLSSVIKAVGSITFEEFRSYYAMPTSEPSAGFIDGDLIEMYLDLPVTKMREVASGLTRKEGDRDVPITVDYLVKFVEELARLH